MLSSQAQCALLLFVMAGLSGCATLPCSGDPATDSYACVERSLQSGVYEKQTHALRQQRLALQEERERLSHRSRTLQLKIAEWNGREQTLARSVTASSEELSGLISQLGSLNDMQRKEVQNYGELQFRALELSRKQRELTDQILARNTMNEDDAETLETQSRYIEGLKRQIETLSLRVRTAN